MWRMYWRYFFCVWKELIGLKIAERNWNRDGQSQKVRWKCYEHVPRFYILLSAQLERAITMTTSFRCNFSHQQCLWIAEAWLNFWFLYVIFIYIMFCKYIYIYIYIYIYMYVCIDISLFRFVLLCFDFFFLWKWGRMKNISKVTYLYLILPYPIY